MSAPTLHPVVAGSTQLVRWWQLCQDARGPALDLRVELDQVMSAHVVAFTDGGSRALRVEPDLLRAVSAAAAVGYRLCAVASPAAPGAPGGCWLPERHVGGVRSVFAGLGVVAQGVPAPSDRGAVVGVHQVFAAVVGRGARGVPARHHRTPVRWAWTR